MSARTLPLTLVLAVIVVLGSCSWSASNRHDKDDNRPRKTLRR